MPSIRMAIPPSRASHRSPDRRTIGAQRLPAIKKRSGLRRAFIPIITVLAFIAIIAVLSFVGTGADQFLKYQGETQSRPVRDQLAQFEATGKALLQRTYSGAECKRQPIDAVTIS